MKRKPHRQQRGISLGFLRRLNWLHDHGRLSMVPGSSVREALRIMRQHSWRRLI